MHSRVHRFFLPRIKVTLLSIGICIFLVSGLFIVSKTALFLQRLGLTPLNIYRIVFSRGVGLRNTDGRTNVLLLGVGGNGHEGGDLTDTMLIISLDDIDHTMALISIPRDVWSDTLKDKVNSAYHYGELSSVGGGLILAKTITEEITGIPIHYSLLFDFSVFSDAVDFVGGIDVDVPIPFTDTEYPIAGKENDTCNGDPEVVCRYMTVTFEKGKTHMDGKRALEYVRSRHAEGIEGTDFSRSARQQEVLLAIRSNVSDRTKWVGMAGRLKSIGNILEKIKSDMTVSEMVSYGKNIQSVQWDSVKKISIDMLFESPPEAVYDGKYVLIPVENYDTVHVFIGNALENK